MKYKDELQEKIAKEYGLDELITNNSYEDKPYNEDVREWYFKQLDKFIATLRERNGTTLY